MLPFRVFARTEPRSAKLHYRLSSPAASSDPNPFSCSSIQPLSFQTFTDSPPQRTKHISFCSNHLRTLFIAMEGIPPLPILELIPRHLLFSIPFLFMYLREPILQPLSFHIHPGMGGCTPRRSDLGRSERADVQTNPFVPLRHTHFGATIRKGIRFLYDPGKQLRSPRCLRLRERTTGQALGPLCKSCLGSTF
jgi:hypothetical protein